MKQYEITAWFFIVAKEVISNSNYLQFRFKALLGSKQCLLRDDYQLESGCIYILEMTSPLQCQYANKIRNSHDILVTGHLQKAQQVMAKVINISRFHNPKIRPSFSMAHNIDNRAIA